jgi:hypothetical protein|tara:strand:+ start:1070 stop:2020 length:951 start_codon:yes stop_codon:yes gene_type:complete
MVECSVCQKEFEGDKNLHLHIKAHKLSIGDYYHTQFPRHDLHTKELIKFKNKEQYFSTDFNNKRNLKSWLKQVSMEKAKKYCKGLLTKRKREKGIEYTPTEVELRTLLVPPIHYYQIIFGDYYKLCEEIGFKNKLSQIPAKKIEGLKFKEEFDEDHIIYIDSREQNPLQIKDFPTEVKGLKFGDYCLNDREKTGNCYIERKSVPDLIGTLSSGLERFEKEIERAAEENAYLVILVERKLEECLAFNKLPYVYKKNTRVTPDFIFHNVRSLLQKFPHIQFLFVDGRKECVRIVKKLLLTKILRVKFDLQLAYDLKLL